MSIIFVSYRKKNDGVELVQSRSDLQQSQKLKYIHGRTTDIRSGETEEWNNIATF